MNPVLRVLLIIIFCIESFGSSSKTNFVRVVFNKNASYEATIIWNQLSGEFTQLVMDKSYPDQNSSVYSLSDENHYKGMDNHIVRLKNLEPNTRYYFYIEDSEGKNQVYYFTTVSDDSNDKISFIAGGDSRDTRIVRVKANLMVSKLKAHAVLFNGDFTGIDTERQWKEWFIDWENSISSDGRITPLVVTRGNHELGNRVMLRLFDVPHSKVFYSTTFGGDLLNLISLNSEIWKFGSQRLFLRKTLKEHKDYYWQIPQYHRPIRAHVKAKKEMNTQYKNFVPEFEKFNNVRLCLENDSHTCKITWPIISDDTDQA
ncbi:MAG: fibronectin type III domain-containing protein, partial [Flavobacteriales bacterium]|nr:fibronectin type III domain-containing protein [Flavobacteriales bacterium]